MEDGDDAQNAIVGDICALIAMIFWAGQLTYEEKFVKKHNIKPMNALGLEGTFSLIILSFLLVGFYYLKVWAFFDDFSPFLAKYDDFSYFSSQIDDFFSRIFPGSIRYGTTRWTIGGYNYAFRDLLDPWCRLPNCGKILTSPNHLNLTLRS